MATQQEINGLLIDISKFWSEEYYIGVARKLEELIKLAPGNADYYSQLARCYSKLTQREVDDKYYHFALHYYQLAIDCAKNDIDKANYYADRAKLRSISGRKDDKLRAFEDFQTAIQVDPSNPYYQQQADRLKPIPAETKDEKREIYQKLKSLEVRSNWATIKAITWGGVSVAACLAALLSIAVMITNPQLIPILFISFGLFGSLFIFSASEAISNNEMRKELNENINDYEKQLGDIVFGIHPTHKPGSNVNVIPVNQPAVRQGTPTTLYPSSADSGILYPNMNYPDTMFSQGRTLKPSSETNPTQAPSAPTLTSGRFDF